MHRVKVTFPYLLTKDAPEKIKMLIKYEFGFFYSSQQLKKAQFMMKFASFFGKVEID